MPTTRMRRIGRVLAWVGVAAMIAFWLWAMVQVYLAGVYGYLE